MTLASGTRLGPYEIVLAVAAATWLAGAVHWGRYPQPSFLQVSFRQGRIGKARFTPGGQDVVYDASWQGEPWQLFSSPIADPKERPLGQSDAQLMDLSPAGSTSSKG